MHKESFEFGWDGNDYWEKIRPIEKKFDINVLSMAIILRKSLANTCTTNAKEVLFPEHNSNDF
jgi:hypothetical protein